MDDKRVWEFETGLWKGDAEHYHKSIDDNCLMVLPTPPYVMQGSDAMDAVSNTPRWSEVAFDNQQISRPEEGLIVVAYGVNASREGEQSYQAHCTSTYRRLSHDDWRVVQHQQTPMMTG